MQSTSFVRAEMEKHRIPGLSPSGISRRCTDPRAGIWALNVELQVPVKPETVFSFRLGRQAIYRSRIHMLVEEGKVALDDH